MATRRLVLKLASLGSMLAAALAPRRAAAQAAEPRTYVLVHGAWHGGWCWRKVADRLRDQGHRVFTPTFTGLGERRHLIGHPDISLDLFIRDVINVIEAEELKDVCLVGHSFAGPIVSGVADRIPKRLKRIVFLDAVILQNGNTFLDTVAPELREAALRRIQEIDGVRTLPPPPNAAAFGVTDPEAAAWVERKLTPQPADAYTTPLQLAHPLGNGLPVTYVRCIEPIYHGMDASGAYAKAQGSWQYVELETGHDAMVTAPDRLSGMLVGLG